jgi:hypothetical protein
MTMSDRWRRNIRFHVGDTAARMADVGPPDPTPDHSGPFGALRVGFLGIATVPGWTAVVRICEDLEVGPLDLPFLIGLELPARVRITPPSGGVVVETIVSLSSTERAPAAIADGATYSQYVTLGTVVAIPQWVTAISLLSPLTNATLRDSLGAIVDIISGLRVPRPRGAVTVAPSADTALVFHYNL